MSLFREAVNVGPLPPEGGPEALLTTGARHLVRAWRLAGENGEAFPDFAGLGEGWTTGSEYVSLYPNVLLGVHCDHLFAIVLEPLGTSRTREHISIYYAEPEVGSARYRQLREANAEQWREVFMEDMFVVEGMQKGRRGPFFDGGRFSPVMDSPTHLFHQWVATMVEAGRRAASG